MNLAEEIEFELFVRRLRCEIYGPITDETWNGIKANWMKQESVEWLKQKVRQDATKRTNSISGPLLVGP